MAEHCIKSELCEIEFEDSPMKVVYSGQLIKGNVILKLKQEIVIRGVYLRFFGQAYCQLSGVERNLNEVQNQIQSQTQNPSRNAYYIPISTEKYFDERIVCLDGTTDKHKLDATTHRFPFQCQLTSLLPTSMEEKYGHIRYTASIRFTEFWEQAPIHEELFTVVKPLNLNLLPNLHEPFSEEEKNKFYLCCLLPFCESNPMKMVARIPQRGYTPGQNIDLQLNIENKSSEEGDGVMVQIIKEVKFYANQATGAHTTEPITDTVTLSDQMLESFNSDNEQMKTYHIKIVVPSTPPTDEKTSNIIHISYKLQISAIVGVCHFDPTITIPITIGTYPIAERQWANASNIYLRPVDESSSQGSNQPTTSTLKSPQTPKPSAPFPESDPPTYEEAMHSNANNNLNETFKPKYPVYRRTS